MKNKVIIVISLISVFCEGGSNPKEDGSVSKDTMTMVAKENNLSKLKDMLKDPQNKQDTNLIKAIQKRIKGLVNTQDNQKEKEIEDIKQKIKDNLNSNNLSLILSLISALKAKDNLEDVFSFLKLELNTNTNEKVKTLLEQKITEELIRSLKQSLDTLQRSTEKSKGELQDQVNQHIQNVIYFSDRNEAKRLLEVELRSRDNPKIKTFLTEKIGLLQS